MPQTHLLPPEATQVLLVLFLSFLLGLEREEHKAQKGAYTFGGIRTFPLLAFLGYGLALLSPDPLLPALGFLAVGGLMGVSFAHKLRTEPSAGLTTELSGLCIYVVGALVAHDRLWIATALGILALLLLELKGALEQLARRVPASEIIAFTQFLLLTAVILPIVPNQDFTSFHINPFKTWLVVVAVSAVTYGGYVLEKLTAGRGGPLLQALLGGVYSSTITTVVLAKRAAQERLAHDFSGSILAASGVMYLRLAVLVGVFNPALGLRLAPALVPLGLLAVLAGWLWTRRPDGGTPRSDVVPEPRNPLEIKAALLFAALFVFVVVATRLAVDHLGHGGLYSLAALMGVSDVDPFIMGLTQTAAGNGLAHATAAVGILIAAASNNLVKGAYALAFADRRTGREAFALLLLLALLGLAAVRVVL